MFTSLVRLYRSMTTSYLSGMVSFGPLAANVLIGKSDSSVQHMSRMLNMRFFISSVPPVLAGLVCPPRLFSGFPCF